MSIKKAVLVIFISLGLSFRTEPVFLHVEGLVTVDGIPVPAAIEINSLQKNTTVSLETSSEKQVGNFMTRLPAGDEYEIVVRVSHFPQQVINLNTSRLDSSQILNVFADFISPEYDRKLEELIKSNEQILKKHQNFNSENFSGAFGNTRKEQLEFKVQIAAYKFFENFNYNNVMGFPKIIRKTDNDQITRFTMGGYATYNEAASLLKDVQKSGLKDAFVIAVYNGEKKMLQQLVDEKIITDK